MASATQVEHKPAASETPSKPAASSLTLERAIAWVGSAPSLVLHTLVFASFFVVSLIGWVAWDQMLLVLTTILSLEAIYLAIFIQMSVNRQAASLKEVEADVEVIQENVEELKEDVGEIQEDVGEISGEISDDHAEEQRKARQSQMLEALSKDVQAMLRHIEAMKSR